MTNFKSGRDKLPDEALLELEKLEEQIESMKTVG